ncbi:unnamed protein product [Meloidogyne enterolobii]|uniref:Uncharacterized protein n=1 Tax=Meloidogyne enterolobii TaxID=390850 RepID=A0ACB1AGK4_MELEN
MLVFFFIFWLFLTSYTFKFLILFVSKLFSGLCYFLYNGEPFLDSHYFLSEDKTGLGAQRRRKRSLESIQDRPEVAELIVDRPRRRVKRDYIEQPSIIGPLEETQSGRKRRQTTFFERRPVPKLPFPDPLYQDQWYLVSFFCFFLIF